MRYNPLFKLLLIAFLLNPLITRAQTDAEPDTGEAEAELTLEQCIEYALKSRPAVEQALIDEAIGERQINAALSQWLPQISAQFNATHNILLQTAAFGEELIRIGRPNTSNLQFQASQVLYNNDVVFAARTARFRRQQLDQNTEDTKINTVVEVSKAFYEVLLTAEQLRILDENIERLQKQYKDAFSRYETGLVDKTDYQRASITLANTRADRKRVQETIKASVAYLKQLMGYPEDKELELTYSYSKMQEQILIDTIQEVEYNNRIEYQLLQTQEKLLDLNTSYFKWSFLPTIGGFINYNFLYFGENVSDLYNEAYPTSAVGLSVALPIFQGTRRIQNIRIAQLQERRLEFDEENLKNVINTQYESALANYKSDLFEFETLQNNVEIAREVYDITRLQYNEGVKTYLELIVAETDLRTTQINYYNALYQVLSSKLDLQKALGTIEVN